jgi:hypothetical protein
LKKGTEIMKNEKKKQKERFDWQRNKKEIFREKHRYNDFVLLLDSFSLPSSYLVYFTNSTIVFLFYFILGCRFL